MPSRFAAGPDEVVLYALSTCIWCRRTRRLLDRLGTPYRLVEVDLLSGPEREDAYGEVRRWSSSGAFPVLVVHGRTVIQGFHEDRITEALGG